MGPVRKGFRVCDGCGLVLQDPAVPPEVMHDFYAAYSNYTNPMSEGLPSATKVRAVDAQLGFLGERVRPGASIFQVGSSDGYTLSRFKELGCVVKGCDPSPNAAAVASRLWNVETHVSTFEDYAFAPRESYDWIVLTHVLEHIYDPVETLGRCAAALAEGAGRLFIEVPVLAAADRLPPAYFQFEHVNYFSELSLEHTLGAAGFEIEGEIQVDLESDLYPIQRLVARRRRLGENGSEGEQAIEARNETAQNEDRRAATAIARSFTQREQVDWSAFEAKILESVGEDGEAYVWGAGIHTSILLGRTGIAKRLRLRGFVDSDSQKWGKTLCGLPVLGPDSLLDEMANGTASVVISTRPGEPAITRYLLDHGLPADRIVRLYGESADRLPTRPQGSRAR